MTLEIAYLIEFFCLKIIPMLVFHFTIDVYAVILAVIYIVQDFPHLLQSLGHLVLLTKKALYSNQEHLCMLCDFVHEIFHQ